MSYFSKLLSHEGKLLINHLENVGKLSKKFIEILPIENKGLLSEVAYLIGISHDFAKATTYFQEKLKPGKETEKADHSVLSSLFSFWIILKFLEKRKILENYKYLPLFGCMAVAKHHGDIENFEYIIENIENDEKLIEQANNIKHNTIKEVSEIYKQLLQPLNIQLNIKEFLDNIEEIINNVKEYGDNFNPDLEKYFEFLLLYSSLIDADKLDASCETQEEFEDTESLIFQRVENLNPNLVDEYKKYFLKSEKEIDKLRNEAYKEVIEKISKINLEKHRLFSLELPTGMGKTLIAFSFALKLRDRIQKTKGYTPRIIYSLPFLSIIDQNSEVIKDVLVGINIPYEKYVKLSKEERNKQRENIQSNLFLKHHHLSDIRYTTDSFSGEAEEFEKDKALLLIEGWYSEIVVTTFAQLFESLITNKNRSIRKVHNIPGSIIILDEFQSVPYEYWEVTRKILKFLSEKWKCYIILMTATMPKILEQSEMFCLINNPEKYFTNENLNRYTISVNMKKLSLEEFCERIFSQHLNSERDILIVVNTIKCSQQLYEMFKIKFKEKGILPKAVTQEGIAEYEDFYLINLNSNIVPLHRLARIKKIKEDKLKRKIIISTQLVEAGVDIDVDVVFRDFSPIDSIVQSAGRCNRNNEKKKGNVFVIRLVDENGNVFSKRIYGKIAENVTEEILKNVNVLEEKDIREYVEKHFDITKHRRDIRKWLDEVCNMCFTEISDFSLIKTEFGKEDVCICFDDALKIIDEIKKKKEEIKTVEYKNKFKILAEIKELRKKLENFIISPWLTTVEHIFPFLPDENLWKIRVIPNPEEADKWYDLEKGFILLKGNSNNRFL